MFTVWAFDLDRVTIYSWVEHISPPVVFPVLSTSTHTAPDRWFMRIGCFELCISVVFVSPLCPWITILDDSSLPCSRPTLPLCIIAGLPRLIISSISFYFWFCFFLSFLLMFCFSPVYLYLVFRVTLLISFQFLLFKVFSFGFVLVGVFVTGKIY